MQRDDVRERPDGAPGVLPRRARQPREAVLRRDRVLVEALGGEPARGLVVLHAVRDDGGEVDVAAEVAREVACGARSARAWIVGRLTDRSAWPARQWLGR